MNQFGRFEAHTGEDYTVVMLPGECTETASIHVYGPMAEELADFIVEHCNGAIADPVEELTEAIAWVERNHPLPRCAHGKALRDGAGEPLAPDCGCKLTEVIPHGK